MGRAYCINFIPGRRCGEYHGEDPFFSLFEGEETRAGTPRFLALCPLPFAAHTYERGCKARLRLYGYNIDHK